MTSRNGVSSVSPKAAEFQLVRIETDPAAPFISKLTIVDQDQDSVTLSWMSTGTVVSTVLGYDVMIKVVSPDAGQTPLPFRTIQVSDLSPLTLALKRKNVLLLLSSLFRALPTLPSL